VWQAVSMGPGAGQALGVGFRVRQAAGMGFKVRHLWKGLRAGQAVGAGGGYKVQGNAGCGSWN
jgi:hypothetical protein